MTDKKVNRLIFTKRYSYAPKPQLPTSVYLPSDDPQAVNSDCFKRAIAGGFAYESKPKPKKAKAE